MGSRSEEQMRVHHVLREAITTLCMQELGALSGFNLEALIGITPYDGNVMLVSINETIDMPHATDSTEDRKNDLRQDNDPNWPQKRRLLTHRKRKRKRPQKVILLKEKRKSSISQEVDRETALDNTRNRSVSDNTDVNAERTSEHGEADGVSTPDTTHEHEEKLHVQDYQRLENTELLQPTTDISILPDMTCEAVTETSQVMEENGDTDGGIPQVGPYRCHDCSAVYKYRKCYIEHRLKCQQGMPDDSQPEEWPCRDCSKTFTSRRSLKLHSAVHSGDRQRYPCTICNQRFLSKRNVDFHISTVHEGNYPFVCDLCGKQATTKLALESHKASKHDINKVKCDKCHREYAKANALESHICIEKRPKFETLCHICNKEFDLPQRLVQHMAKHLDPRYQCESCGRNFKWASSLQAHKVAAHGCVDGAKQQERDSVDQLPDNSVQMVSDSEQKKQHYQHTALVASMYSNSHPDVSHIDAYSLPQEQHMSVPQSTSRPLDSSQSILHQFNHAEPSNTNHAFLAGIAHPGALTDITIDQMHAVWQASFANQEHHS